MNPIQWWLNRAKERRERRIRLRSAYKAQVADIVEHARSPEEAIRQLHVLDRAWKDVDIRA